MAKVTKVSLNPLHAATSCATLLVQHRSTELIALLWQLSSCHVVRP